MKIVSTIFAFLLLSNGIFATGSLWSWSHGACFRNYHNRCDEGKTYVRTSDLPANCGCLTKEQYTPIEECASSQQCDVESGESFLILYPGESRGGNMPAIGCGCFKIEE